MIQRHDRQARMTGGIRRNIDCLDTFVLDHFFTGGVGFGSTHGFGQCLAATGVKIGCRNHLDIGMILIEKKSAEFAKSITGNAHSNFSIGL